MKKILVIDEDKPLRNSVMTELRRNGFEALGAANGAEGVALAKAQAPSLVLCDLNLAGRSGLDVLRELRLQPATSSIPVILMTGAADQADARPSLDPGADGYLRKPFALESMLTKVQARLQRLDGSQGAGAAKPQPEHISADKKLGEAVGINGEVHQMTARGFRNILQVVVLVFVFTLVQVSGLQWVCNHGMQVAQSLENQGLPNLNQLTALREHLILFRLYAYEYLFARENKRPRLARAVKEVVNQTQIDLAKIQELLHDPRGQPLAATLGTSFAELAREFDRVQGLVDNNFTGAMVALDNDVPPMIQKVDAAAVQLTIFGYQLSTVQANATFHSFESIKNWAIVFGIVNMVVALGLLLFVRRAARKTRSQLVKALDQLNEQAQALRLQTSALEAAANGISITRRNGNIVWVNRAFTRLTGYASEEVVGKNTRLLKSGRHTLEFYRDLWATINAGKVWHGELVNRRKDGSFYDEEMTITPVAGEDGKVQNFIAIKQDVSERKRNQQLLTHERDLLQSLMDNLPDFIFFKDANSRFTRINLALARYFGLTGPEAAIGKSDADFFPMREARQKLVDERRLLATGKPVQGLVEKSDRAGDTKWVSSTKVPIYGEAGKITGLVGISHDVTESKRVEETLQRQQAELRALFDLMPALIWFKDTENRILRVNQQVAEQAGKPVAEIEGRPSGEIYPQEAARFYADDLEVIRSGAPKLAYVEMVPGPAGQELWVQTDKVPYCDQNGKVIGIVVMAQDITERKRAEATLMESKRFLKYTLDALSSHIAILDEGGTIVEVNTAWHRFARENGFCGGHCGVGDNYLQICDAAAGDYSEGAAAVASGIRAVMAGNSNEFHLEYPCHSPQEQRWFVVRATRFASDQPVRVVVAHENITKRKRTEEELQRKGAFLEAQVNSSIDGILVVDELGRKTLQNQRLTALLKIPPPIADDEDDEQQLRWVMQKVKNPEQFLEKVLYLNSHRHEIGQDELELQDGTIFDRYSAPMTGADGKYYGRMWIFRDITERRRTEMDWQMMEMQLRQSQKLESIGQLAAGIAHEINTPSQYVGDNTRFVKDSFAAICSVLKSHEELLASARNNIITPELLARNEALLLASDLDYLCTQIPAALAETLEGVERVTKIVRAMKDFSHPGGQSKTPADLNRAIESTVTVARNEWKYVAELKLELEPELPPIPCFIGEFNQCILNLVVNAAHAIGDVVKKNPGTKGSITVSTRRDGNQIEVRVADTGTGIAEANRPKIFAPFFTTKDVGKGTGQGLAIVYGSIVKRHGGSVRFETEVGKGTAFIIRLPISPLLSMAANPSQPVELATS
jgi:PAS domain S-box-containing protein